MTHSIPRWLRLLAWIGVAVWATTITVLSSMTPPQLEEVAPFQMWDKAAHFTAFLAGGVNLALALRWSTTWPWKKTVLFAITALAIFGALDELHQLTTPNRSGADPLDWTADLLGAATGILLTALLHARLKTAHRSTPA